MAMTTSDKLRKDLIVNQLVETGKWIPVDALGREVKAQDREHVELLACAKCGKTYKWNQTSWMKKHEEEHAHEGSGSVHREADHSKGREESVPSELSEIQAQLWNLMEMVDRLVNAKKQKRTA